jgi:plasmid stability protein
MLAVMALIASSSVMSSLTIRKLDDDVKKRLRQRAAARGVSMEEEARMALRKWVEPNSASTDRQKGLGTRIRERFAEFGGVELDIPPRGPGRLPPDFSE